MSYFLIYGTESGTKIKQFLTKGKLIEHLDEYFSENTIEFMNHVPEDPNYFYDGLVIVIQGEIVKPKPITIVKTFKIE